MVEAEAMVADATPFLEPALSFLVACLLHLGKSGVFLLILALALSCFNLCSL